MLHDALLIIRKDLKIEFRSKVTTNQVAPMAIVILILFAFALDTHQHKLILAAPGLFWVAVLFSMSLAIHRSFSIETSSSTRDGLRLLGLDPGGIFLGKVIVLTIEMFVLEIILGFGIVVLYSATLHNYFLLISITILSTLGLAAAGTIFGSLASSFKTKDTLLPLLFLPISAPVLLSATKAFQTELGTVIGSSHPWIRILGVFAVVYLTVGVLAFGPLLEEQ